MTLIYVLLMFLQLFADTTNGDRILGLFIHTGGSHFYSFYPIMKALAEKGHNITVLSYFKVKNPHPLYNELVIEGEPVINSTLEFKNMMYPSRSLWTLYKEYIELYEIGQVCCHDSFKSPHIDKIFQIHAHEPFDLAVTELFDTDCVLGIVHKLDIPYVGISSCAMFPWYFDRVNTPELPSYVPSGMLGYSWEMNLYERTRNWFNLKLMKLLYRYTQMHDNELIRERFGEGIPDVEEIGQKISVIFVNQYFALTGPKPLSPQVIEIGGSHILPPKPLPQNLKLILDNAVDGVILISWGSNIKSSSMPNETLREILLSLSKFKQQIIWKWEDVSLQKLVPENVHIQKWIPQQDILCHPNVKAFWAHGGNLGTIEAVHCGTPIVVTPIYGDQFLNAAALEKRGMGFTLLFEDITANTIYERITKCFDSKVRQNAKKVSFAYRNRPQPPLETAVKWIEYISATHGLDLNKVNAYNMYWFSYHSLDVILVLSSLLFLITGLVWLVLLLCWRRCCRRIMYTSKNEVETKRKQN